VHFVSLVPLPSISFRPTLFPTLAALVVVALTLHLGGWQQGRAAEKRALQSRFDDRAKLPVLNLNMERGVAKPAAGDAEARAEDESVYRRASARGRYVASGQIFLDNKFDGASVGYHVITPLRLGEHNESGAHQRVLLVNRGFVPRGAMYPAPPSVSVPDAELEVSGLLTVPNMKFLELGRGAPIQGSVWQNLTIERYQAQTGQLIVPYLLLASQPGEGLRAVVERPDAKVEKHVEYMLTWYSLAIAVLVLWTVLNVKITSRTLARDESRAA
jgi:surfeit locus 1 family protein